MKPTTSTIDRSLMKVTTFVQQRQRRGCSSEINGRPAGRYSRVPTRHVPETASWTSVIKLRGSNRPRWRASNERRYTYKGTSSEFIDRRTTNKHIYYRGKRGQRDIRCSGQQPAGSDSTVSQLPSISRTRTTINICTPSDVRQRKFNDTTWKIGSIQRTHRSQHASIITVWNIEIYIWPVGRLNNNAASRHGVLCWR